MFTRARYQFGWLELRKRKKGPSVWLWRYRSTDSDGRRDKGAVVIGDVEQYPTKALAWKAGEGLRLTVNRNNPGAHVTFGALIDKYMREQLPERYGTASKYCSWLTHHIKHQWGDYPIAKIKPVLVEEWIGKLDLAPKSKGAYPKHDAYPLSVGHEMGIVGSSTKSHEARSSEGLIEEGAGTTDTDGKTVPSLAAICGGAFPHDVHRRDVSRNPR